MKPKRDKTEIHTLKKPLSRPPVVTVLGHVDHGKSTLLDYIRKANTVLGEAGGITQHTSAYEITHQGEDGTPRRITFIDTPGHEAFTTMRSRGTSVADVAILVVSAEEGVKPQTLECIKLLEESKTPFVVAITKMDRPSANPNLVKQQLAEAGVYIEGYGGSVPAVPVSAKNGEGIPELLDIILLIADLAELKQNPETGAEGFILESRVEPRSGILAVAIIKNGTLLSGELVAVYGCEPVKIKRLENFLGKSVSELSASSPAHIYGLRDLPEPGSVLKTLRSKGEVDLYQKELAARRVGERTRVPGREKNEPSEETVIPIIIKTDANGTMEALEHELGKLSVLPARIKILAKGIGDIGEGDIKLAATAEDPIMLGFHVGVDRKTKDLLDRYKITPHTFDVIYKLTEFLASEIKRRLPPPPVPEERITGKVIKLFGKTKSRQLVGVAVSEGTFKKGAGVSILRNNFEIGKGKIIELQVDRVAAAEASEGTHAGIMVEAKTSIALGDELKGLPALPTGVSRARPVGRTPDVESSGSL